MWLQEVLLQGSMTDWQLPTATLRSDPDHSWSTLSLGCPACVGNSDGCKAGIEPPWKELCVLRCPDKSFSQLHSDANFLLFNLPPVSFFVGLGPSLWSEIFCSPFGDGSLWWRYTHRDPEFYCWKEKKKNQTNKNILNIFLVLMFE